jgi:hypothetical protein
MATYATADDLRAYVDGDDGAERVLRRMEDDAIEGLLERGERAVDLALGPQHYTRDAATGLLLDPSTLTTPQQGALSRAVCAYGEWELLIGREFASGDSVEVPVAIAIASPPARQPPRMLAELAGFGLLRRSATVLPSPPPTHAGCDGWADW